jgi:ribosomal protein S15P/S13E
MLLREVDRIEQRIQRSYQRRAISQREAQRLSREASDVRQRILRSGRDGLSQREFYALQSRVNQLQHHLREERRDGDNRRW